MTMTERTNHKQALSSGAKAANKLLVIGIDGGTLDIVLPMVQAGKLPNLSGLIQNGAYGTLRSTIPPVTAPAWSSFITGTNPGRHGVFHFFKYEKDVRGKGGKQTLMHSGLIKGIPFWDVLKTHGNKVGLINLPLTYPPHKVDGFMVSGMLVPQGSKDYVYPPGLISKLANYTVDIDGLLVQNQWQGKKLVQEDRHKFIKTVFDISTTRAHNAIHLMKVEPWDLFMIVFTGSDRICHFFWEDPNFEKTNSSVVEDYYLHLDGLIGDLRQAAGKDTTILVMSDHGFGPAPKRTINAFRLLKRLGLTTFVPNFTFTYIKSKILRKLGKSSRMAPGDFVDFKRSKIFFKPIYANFMGISINAAGIEGSGVVSTDNVYQKLKDEITGKLEELIDPVTGKRLVKKIHDSKALYCGPHAHEVADMIIQFSYDYHVEFSPLNRALVYSHKDQIRTGEHRMEGLFIASGPQVEPGRLDRELKIQDVTPTLLYLLKTPIPESYDGRLITELFNDDYLARNRPRYEAVDDKSGSGADPSKEAKQEEFEKSKSLLEGLGYL